METKVKMNAKSGLVITPNSSLGKDGKQYGYIIVEQSVRTYNEQGFRTTNKRTALIKGELAELQADFGKLKDGDKFPDAGFICIVESTTPPYEGASPKINPSTGEVLMHNGSPIYRTTVFSSVNKGDTFLAHDKDSNVVVISANADESAEA